MHGCTQCAAMLVMNTSNRGEVSVHGGAQFAVMLIMNTSKRRELGMQGYTQCAMMLALNTSNSRTERTWYARVYAMCYDVGSEHK
jgi:hypothetical protein